MSKRSHRFRGTVEVPELGTVEIRGVSPDEFAGLPFDVPGPDETVTHDHPIYVAVITAGCVHPRLSTEQVLDLSTSSREALVGAIMTAHPGMRPA
jgi:hypothetical protein